MSNRVMIEHGGEIYDPYYDYDDWSEREGVDPDIQAARDQIIREGVLLLPSGEPMPEREARWTRGMLLGEASGWLRVPEGLKRLSGPEGRRHLIEGLWPWGTYPMIAGTYKAGKTTLIADLVASLLVPGRPFLGRFPVTLTQDERDRGIIVINAETPAEDFENALLEAGVDPDDPRVNVYHLDELGGPGLFDLRDPSAFDAWESEVFQCIECNEGVFWTPAAVVADGLSAILGGPEGYGEWYAAFKRLMKATDIPNAIVTGHTAAGSTHLYDATRAMAGPDGVWSYTTDRPDDPSSPRFFQVLARKGGTSVPRTRIRVGEDGLLVADPPKRREFDAAEPEHESAGADWIEEAAQRMLAKLSEADGEIGQTELAGKGRPGQVNVAALDRLRQTGRAEMRRDGNRKWWRAVDSSDLITLDLSAS